VHLGGGGGAEENRLYEVALTVTKSASDPHLLPYPPKKRWCAVAMAKKTDAYSLPGSRYHVNQRLQQQQQIGW